MLSLFCRESLKTSANNTLRALSTSSRPFVVDLEKRDVRHKYLIRLKPGITMESVLQEIPPADVKVTRKLESNIGGHGHTLVGTFNEDALSKLRTSEDVDYILQNRTFKNVA